MTFVSVITDTSSFHVENVNTSRVLGSAGNRSLGLVGFKCFLGYLAKN